MNDHILLGIHITNRIKKAGDVQKLLTEYGCNIKTRLGLHDVHDNYCSPAGLIVLELYGDLAKCNELEHRLTGIEGVEVRKMVFSHM